MKKTIRNILLVCAGVTMFTACSNVDFDGEHSSDGMFRTNKLKLASIMHNQVIPL